MIESVLVADRGLAANRVVATCRRLGIKTVALGLSADLAERRERTGADDVVLLHDLAEAQDPLAVVRAAQAAGVMAIHPGRGRLAGLPRFVEICRDNQLTAVTTVGLPEPAVVQAELAAAGVAVAPDSAADALVVLVAHRAGAVVIGAIGVGGPVVVVPAPIADPDRVAATARSVVARFAPRGLVTVALAGSAVVDVAPSWPAEHAALELVTGVDLVEQELLVAGGEPIEGPPPRARGWAVATAGLVELPEAALADGPEAFRLDVEDVVEGRARVRVATWGEDLNVARGALSAYLRRVEPGR